MRSKVAGHCRVICLLIFSWVLFGCEKQQSLLRIGIHAWPAYEYVYLAQERGLFEQYGVHVEVVEFDSSTDSMRAFAHGTIDAFCGTSVELIASQLGKQIPEAKAIHVIDFSNGADQIIANASITSLAELKGKRIAFESGTLDYVTWSYALKQAGLTFSDVKIESVAQNQLVEAFKLNRVDAAATYPPVSTRLIEENLGHPIFDSRTMPGIIVDLLAVRADLLTTRKAEWIGVVKGLAAAQRYAEVNPEDAYRIMAERQQVSVESFASSMEGIHMATLDEQYGLLKEGGKIYEALQAAQKTLMEKGAPIPDELVRRLYTTQIAQEVMTP